LIKDENLFHLNHKSIKKTPILINNNINVLIKINKNKDLIEIQIQSIKNSNKSTIQEDFFKNYKNYDEINEWIDSKVKNFPNLASIIQIGNSYESKFLP
jgi:uncharacterized protein YllA (UPF0747 family)